MLKRLPDQIGGEVFASLEMQRPQILPERAQRVVAAAARADRWLGC